MSIKEQLQLDDVGTIIRLLIKNQGVVVSDLASATVLSMYFFKPGGTTAIEKTASLTTDGTDGLIQYVVETEFLDTVGLWKVQGYIEYVDGSLWSTSKAEFYVNSNIY